MRFALIVVSAAVIFISGCSAYQHPVAQSSSKWMQSLEGNWYSIDPDSGERLGRFSVSQHDGGLKITGPEKSETLVARGEIIRETLFISLRRPEEKTWTLVALKQSEDPTLQDLCTIPIDQLESAIDSQHLSGTRRSAGDSYLKSMILVSSSTDELMTFLKSYPGPLEVVTKLKKQKKDQDSGSANPAPSLSNSIK